MKHLLIISFAFLLGGFGLKAQDDFSLEIYEEGDQLWGFSYSFGFPSGEFRNFIDETSFRGFHFDYEYFVMNNLSVGLNSSYTLFNEINERDSYTIESENTGVTISSKIWRYTHVVPIHLTSRYYFSFFEDNQTANLFGGIGIGWTYINQEAWVGLSTFREESWKFSMAPELGIDLNTGGRYNIQISGQYLYIPNGLQLVNENNFESWNLKVGFRKWIY
ncbi:MAG: hypothetical protein CMP59_06770 [Flavobacteriales bacterium]|nr:hypothetical protein [Flavobacteriales bacterium]|tara:strand:+ start:256 stop:912 length:657 start_codon:yes stop_codon:yes gene_type:complete